MIWYGAGVAKIERSGIVKAGLQWSKIWQCRGIFGDDN